MEIYRLLVDSKTDKYGSLFNMDWPSVSTENEDFQKIMASYNFGQVTTKYYVRLCSFSAKTNYNVKESTENESFKNAHLKVFVFG